MQAPSFHIVPAEGYDLVRYQGPDRAPTHTVGYVVERPDGFVARIGGLPQPAHLERTYPSRIAAALTILPADSFPELCVRCNEEPPVYDAASIDIPSPGYGEYSYPSELDDVCVFCLDDAHEELEQVHL